MRVPNVDPRPQLDVEMLPRDRPVTINLMLAVLPSPGSRGSTRASLTSGLVPWLAAAAARAVAAAAEGSDASAGQQGGGVRQLGSAVMAAEALAGLCGGDAATGVLSRRGVCDAAASFSPRGMHKCLLSTLTPLAVAFSVSSSSCPSASVSSASELHRCYSLGETGGMATPGFALTQACL